MPSAGYAQYISSHRTISYSSMQYKWIVTSSFSRKHWNILLSLKSGSCTLWKALLKILIQQSNYSALINGFMAYQLALKSDSELSFSKNHQTSHTFSLVYDGNYRLYFENKMEEGLIWSLMIPQQHSKPFVICNDYTVRFWKIRGYHAIHIYIYTMITGILISSVERQHDAIFCEE